MVPDEISSLSGHGDQVIWSCCQISLVKKVTVHTGFFWNLLYIFQVLIKFMYSDIYFIAFLSSYLQVITESQYQKF